MQNTVSNKLRTKGNGGQHKTEQRKEAMEKIPEVKKAYLTAGTPLVTLTSVVPARSGETMPEP